MDLRGRNLLKEAVIGRLEDAMEMLEGSRGTNVQTNEFARGSMQASTEEGDYDC